MAITKSGPASVAVGQELTYTLRYRNLGTGPASAVQVRDTLPAGLTVLRWSANPSGCTVTAATRLLACDLATMAAGADVSASLVVRAEATAAASLLNTATITTTAPGDANAANNTSSVTTAVLRPNVWVGVRATNKTLPLSPDDNPAGALSYIRFRVRYGNDTQSSDEAGTRLPPALRHPSSATAPAVGSRLTLTLPAQAALATVNPVTNASGMPMPYTTGTVGGRNVLVIDLGTLAPLASASVYLTLQSSAAPGAAIALAAEITTSSVGDEPLDNLAQDDTPIVALPDPESSGVLRLMIHSTLDPNAGGTNQTDGVYLSTGAAITWPAGEVLDFSPRLTSLEVRDRNQSGDPLLPYGIEARVTGWSLVSFSNNGQVIDARTSVDAAGQPGCRQGTTALTGTSLNGCTYAYPGATSAWRAVEVALPDSQLTEGVMANQGHAYWTYRGVPGTPLPHLPAERVYLFTLDPVEPVGLNVAVEAAVRLLNLYPRAALGDWTRDPQPIPGSERRQVYPGSFRVNLIVPRSVVGPGGAPGGVSVP